MSFIIYNFVNLVQFFLFKKNPNLELSTIQYNVGHPVNKYCLGTILTQQSRDG